MNQDMSILSLVANASLVVKFVLAILIAVSFASWYWIFRKAFAIRKYYATSGHKVVSFEPGK